MVRRVLVIGALAILSADATAEAVNDTLATAAQAVLGEKRSQTISFDTFGYFGYQLTANRSYAVFCWEPLVDNQGALAGGCALDIRDFADVIVAPTSINIQMEPFPKFGSIAAYTPTSTGSYFVRAHSSTPAPGTTINLIMLETTLAAPWYFVSQPSGYEAFVEIRNHTSFSVSLTVRAYANTGAVVGSTTVSVPANGNTYVTVSSLGVANGSGSLTITHDGMPGAIVANVTTLSGSTGLSFDAPFTPRMVWSMIS